MRASANSAGNRTTPIAGDQGPGEGAARLDVAGAVLATVSVAALIFGLSRGRQRGFGDRVTVGALAAAKNRRKITARSAERQNQRYRPSSPLIPNPRA